MASALFKFDRFRELAADPDGQGVNNIIPGQPPATVNSGLFVEKEERELYAIFSIIKQNVTPMIAKGDFAQAQKIVFRLQPGLSDFFDRVLVMAEETKLRRNRLALLQAISKVLLQIADYSQVVVEGEKPAARNSRASSLSG